MGLIDQVIEVAALAGKEVMHIYDREFSVKEKKDRSPVTEADLVSEKVILGGLKTAGFGICSEESGVKGNREKVWIVDPLDGTMDFIQKTGEFSIMIGLLEKAVPVLGVVALPARKVIYYAQKGAGSFIMDNDIVSKMKVSRIKCAANFRMVISRNHFRQQDKNVALRLGVASFKELGSVGLKLSEIARGEAELCVYQTDKLGLWDCCAPHVILEEAGGEVFDANGDPLHYDFDTLRMAQGLIATNGANKLKILDSIREGRK